MRPQAPLRVQERDNWNFFLELPEMDRRKVKTTPVAPAAAHAPAVRVQRRVRRLRRDALHQDAVAAVRRPRRDRQCHRLLLDLRRQPAHHALLRGQKRPRPDLVQFAVRRQRRVRPRLPRLDRQAEGIRRRTGEETRAATRRRSRRRHPQRRPDRRSGHLRATRTRGRAETEAAQSWTRPKRSCSCRWPTRS